jgi:hypothetical protein
MGFGVRFGVTFFNKSLFFGKEGAYVVVEFPGICNGLRFLYVIDILL